MANAYVRMRHPDYDVLRGMLDDVGPHRPRPRRLTAADVTGTPTSDLGPGRTACSGRSAS